MRKLLIVIMIAAIIVLSSCRAAYTAPQLYSPVENPIWAEAGMDWRVIYDRLEEHGYEVGGIYTFYTVGKKGDSIIVARNQRVEDESGKEFDQTVEIRSYVITESPDPNNFLLIEKGMDLFDVVELIGQVPFHANDATGTSHEDGIGNLYYILWRFDNSLQKLLVESVDILEGDCS